MKKRFTRIAGALLLLACSLLVANNCAPHFNSESASRSLGSTGQPETSQGQLKVWLNDSERTPVLLDQLTTRSGAWIFEDLGAVDDARAYLWRLVQNPDFFRIMICRRSFTKEANDTKDLSLLTVPTRVVFRGSEYEWTLGVAQGSCRVMQNREPVEPNPDWLREAVAGLRLPSYSRDRAWLPDKVAPLTPSLKRGAYDPNSLGVAEGSTLAPASSSNYVGVTSAQGGEYPSSRGFLHNIDAQVVDAALHNEDNRIADIWPQFVQYTYYSLSHPQAAVWSQSNHWLVDPQFPQPGERPWEIELWSSPTTDNVDSIRDVTNWGRDTSHLENTGYVHWILTEDPIAGFVVQRQAAFTLGSFYAYKRTGMTKYGGQTEQERAMYNTLTTLWKSRDVSRRISSQSGKVFWSAVKTETQAADVIAYYDQQVYQKAMAAVPGPSMDYVRKITHVPLALGFTELFAMPAGTQTEMVMVSNFMLPQYGKEPLYLWTKDGNQTVKVWLTEASEHLKLRLFDFGGAAGVDGCVGVRGSSFPLSVSGTSPGYSDGAGWVSWLNSICPSTASRTTYENAGIHTVTQMEGLLLLAQDAGIPGLENVLSRIAEHRAATTNFRYPDLQMHKHFAGPRH